MTNFNDINKNFVIRVEDTSTYFKVLAQSHFGGFRINEKYVFSHISVNNGFNIIYLLNNENIEYGFLEDEVIKVKKETSLHSARTYTLLVGKEIANKHFLDVFKRGLDKTTYKLRRGITVNFCSK